jgi:hypothetical protein
VIVRRVAPRASALNELGSFCKGVALGARHGADQAEREASRMRRKKERSTDRLMGSDDEKLLVVTVLQSMLLRADDAIEKLNGRVEQTKSCRDGW